MARKNLWDSSARRVRPPPPPCPQPLSLCVQHVIAPRIRTHEPCVPTFQLLTTLYSLLSTLYSLLTKTNSLLFPANSLMLKTNSQLRPQKASEAHSLLPLPLISPLLYSFHLYIHSFHLFAQFKIASYLCIIKQKTEYNYAKHWR